METMEGGRGGGAVKEGFLLECQLTNLLSWWEEINCLLFVCFLAFIFLPRSCMEGSYSARYKKEDFEALPEFNIF